MFLDENSVFSAPMRSSRSGSIPDMVVMDDATLDVILRLLSVRSSSSETVHAEMPTHGFFNRGTGVSEIAAVKPREIDVPLFLAEIKRMTGLEWEAIGSLLNVSRQTIYNWKQGLKIKPENGKSVMALRDTIAFIDRGDQLSTMAALNAAHGEGTVLDLLKTGKFALAKVAAKRGPGNPRTGWTKSPVTEALGRTDHWTDRLAADDEDRPLDDSNGFLPNKIRKTIRIKSR